MKTLTLLLLSLFISLSAFACPEDCESQGLICGPSGTCVVDPNAVNADTLAAECQNKPTEAERQQCFRDRANGAMSTMANQNGDDNIKTEDEVKMKGGQNVVPLIATIGIGTALFTNLKGYTSCGQASVYMMMGGAIASITGELVARNYYNRKLQKAWKKYDEQVDTQEFSNNEDEQRAAVSVANQNQIYAFDAMIAQEEARAEAHKKRKEAHMVAGGLYSGAAVAATLELIGTFGLEKSCDPPGFKISKPSGCASYDQSEKNNSYLIAAAPETFREYYYITDLTAEEIIEISLRKVVNAIFPSAHAQFAGDDFGFGGNDIMGEKLNGVLGDDFLSTTSTNTGAGSVGNSALKTGTKVAGKKGWGKLDFIRQGACYTGQAFAVAGKAMANATNWAMKHSIGRLTISTLLGTYSFIVGSKAGERQKQSQTRADELKNLRANIEVVEDNRYAGCTEAQYNSPSAPACYCFLEDGTPHPERMNAAVCAGVKPPTITAPTQYSPGGVPGGGTYAPQPCINKDATLNPTCDCAGDKCVTFKGGLNLGSLANIPDMQNMMRDMKKMTDGKMSHGQFDPGRSRRMAARLKKLKDKLAKDPKHKDKIKKALQLERKAQRAIANAASNPAVQRAFNGMSNLGGGGAPQVSSPMAQKALKKAKSALEKDKKIAAISPARKGNTMSDFDFSDGQKGGISFDEEEAEKMMERNFKVDDINGNSHVSIFKMISNRYQLSGMKRLFEEKALENEK